MNETSENLSEMNAVMYHNLVDEFRMNMYTYLIPGSLVLLCVYLPVFLVALFGNMFVLVIILSNKHMRNVTNYFVVNLAVADLLVTLICIPTAVSHVVYKLWVFGEFMCKTTHYFQGVAVASSVFSLTIVSVDRYLAIRHHTIFRKISTSRHAWKLILLIWLVSLLIMVPIPLTRTRHRVQFWPHQPFFMCTEAWNNHLERKWYGVSMMISVFVIPGFIIAVSYSRIGCNLVTEDLHLHRRDSEVSQSQTHRIMTCRKRVARMLLILIFVFAFCWLPYNVVSLYLDLQPKSKPCQGILPFMLCLAHANSAINPVLYCLINKFAKKSLKRLICGKSKRKSRLQLVHKRIIGIESDANAHASALTVFNTSRRSLVRKGSRSNSNTSVSIRFSRSSNRSFRSTSFKSNAQHAPQTTTACCSENKPKVCANVEHVNGDGAIIGANNVDIHLPITVHDDENLTGDLQEDSPKRRRENLRFTIDIPSTINEESSRTTSQSYSKLSRRDQLGCTRTQKS